MTDHWRTWLAWGKALLALLILVGVVWFFARILGSAELQATDTSRTPGQILGDAFAAAHLGWLLLAACLYLAGLGFSAVFWILLLRWSREPLPLRVAVRAYYLSHLGKYAPIGKGWALLMRVGQATQGGVRASTAAVTTAYETLTSIAAGALLAAGLLLLTPGVHGDRLLPALGLLVLVGLPIIPGVFNYLTDQVGARFHKPGQPWPRFGSGALLSGLALTACGWFLLGGSLAATLWAIEPLSSDLVSTGWFTCTAYIAISYVAGFIASTPGGLGVRELVLQQLLAPTLGVRAVVVVILLRVLWTIAEVLVASVVFWWPRNARRE